MRNILGEEAAGGPRIAVDERSNVVLVRGSASAIAEARRIAVLLDTPATAVASTRVFRLRFGDAETVAEILRGLLGGEASTTNPVARSLADGSGGAGQTSIGGGIGAAAVNRFDAQGPGGTPAGSSTPAQTSQRTAAPTGFSTPDLAIQPAPDLNAIVV
jgi:general secretion pathway protein D